MLLIFLKDMFIVVSNTQVDDKNGQEWIVGIWEQQYILKQHSFHLLSLSSDYTLKKE